MDDNLLKQARKADLRKLAQEVKDSSLTNADLYMMLGYIRGVEAKNLANMQPTG